MPKSEKKENDFHRTPKEWRTTFELGVVAGPVPPGGKADIYDEGVELVNEYLDSYLSTRKTNKILEIGSGNGRIAVGLLETKKDIEYVGIDIIPQSVRFCREFFPENFEFYYKDIQHDRYNIRGTYSPREFSIISPDDVFDLVVCHSIFTHMTDWVALVHYVSEVHRVLRKDGVFYATFFKSPPNEVNTHHRRTVYPEQDILSLFDENFEIIDTRDGDTEEWRDQFKVYAKKV